MWMRSFCLRTCISLHSCGPNGCIWARRSQDSRMQRLWAAVPCRSGILHLQVETQLVCCHLFKISPPSFDEYAAVAGMCPWLPLTSELGHDYLLWFFFLRHIKQFLILKLVNFFLALQYWGAYSVKLPCSGILLCMLLIKDKQTPCVVQKFIYNLNALE